MPGEESDCRKPATFVRTCAAIVPAVLLAVAFLATGDVARASDLGEESLLADPNGVACDPNSSIDPCPGDGNLCTVNYCNPSTRKCEYPAVTCTPDDNKCTLEECNPANGQCVSKPPIDCPGDGDLCTTDTCNPETGQCVSSAPKECPAPIDNLCSVGTCNASTGQCQYTPITCGSDDNLCTEERCNPSTGHCESGAPSTCNTDNKCVTATCNAETGQCDYAPVVCDQDDNLCTVESCDPATGECRAGETKTCNTDNKCVTASCNPENGQCGYDPVRCDQDDNRCTVESCDPETGSCKSGETKSCAPDDNLCTRETCVPATGLCVSGEPTSCEPDSDECTTEECQPSTGRCVSTPANPTPDNCGPAICRTPGFWGTHAGVEKAGSQNIVQAVITAGGGVLSICGESITNTVLNDDDSAVEAICLNVKDGIKFQLARQLTSAALNCIVSDGVANCSGTPLYASIFGTCNTLCANGGTSSALTACVNRLDCLNNGGKVLANGSCQLGTCSGGESPCSNTLKCSEGSVCEPLPGNCHDRDLENPALGLDFEPPGNAGSSDECNLSIKNRCKVIGSAQSYCQF